MSVNISDFESPRNLLIYVHDPVQLSPFVEIVSDFRINLPCLVLYQPPSCEVFTLQYLDENRGQLDFVFSVVLPFRKVFLHCIVLYFGVLFGFFFCYFSAVVIIDHLLLMEIRDIFIIAFGKTFTLIQGDKVLLTLKNVLIVLHTMQIFIEPFLKLVKNIVFAHHFLLVCVERIQVGKKIWWTKPSILIGEVSLDLCSTSGLTQNRDIHIILGIKFIFKASFRKQDVFLVSRKNIGATGSFDEA